MMGLGKKQKSKKKLAGGYDINIAKPLPVVAPLEDLRGNLRPVEDRDSRLVPAGEPVVRIVAKKGSGKKKGAAAPVFQVVLPEKVPAMVEGTGKMSKAKMRGLMVARVMKERGVKLGEASKIVSEHIKLKGSGFWDDFSSGFQSVIQAAVPLLPFLL